MLKENYHTHTFRCHHATGDVEDYCREAVRQGLETLGMSDHVPYPDDYPAEWHDWAMAPAEIPGYLAAIEAARRDFPSLRLLRAFECEYNPELMPFYSEVIRDGCRPDYLILGVHYAIRDGKEYSPRRLCVTREGLHFWTDWMLEGMHSGFFQMVAHPDLFMQAAIPWNGDCDDCARHILSAAEGLNLPLEVNAYGLRKPRMDDGKELRHQYPHPGFWNLARDYDIPVLIGSDAHRPEDVYGNMDEAAAFLPAGHPWRIVNHSFLATVPAGAQRKKDGLQDQSEKPGKPFEK